MNIEKFERNRYGINSYVVYNDKDAIIIDPGFNANSIIDFIDHKNVKPLAILLTHGHVDHIAETAAVKEKYNLDVYVHKFDNEMLINPEFSLADKFGLPELSFEADKLFSDGDVLKFNDFEFKVFHTPGHTKGGVVFQIEDVLFTGDTLFRGSMGRTDLYGGNDEHIKASLLKLSQMDANLIVHPGHGPSSNIGFERDNNPFIKRI